jgi:hypothetical protein
MNEPSRKDQDAAATPNTLLGTVCLVCVCATVVFIVYLASPHTEEPRRLWTPVLVETNGNETILPESRQLEFWTPSAKTQDYLHRENGQVVPTEMWEVISNDAPVEQFGMLLHANSSVIGYRRVEVWGQGKTSYKPGWWWTLNVFTNYSAADLSRAYESYWKSHQILFIEVIDNRGSAAN